MRHYRDQYFLKDKTARIYYDVEAALPDGSEAPTYKRFKVAATQRPIWCYSSQLTQNQIFYHGVWFSEDETRMFVFNHLTGVKLYDYIRYRGEWYTITRIDNPYDYNEETFVYVKDVAIGDKPKDDEIKPYGWEPEDDGYISR